MKQRELSLWLKSVIILGAGICLACCFIFAPALIHDAIAPDDSFSYIYWPSLIYLWIASVPFYISLVLTWKISTEIGKDNSFCEANSRRLKYISRLSLFDAMFLAIGGVALIMFDTVISGLLVTLIFITIVFLALSVICAALSHLTYKAYLIKQDNDLTI